jgi:hypothetical protein
MNTVQKIKKEADVIEFQLFVVTPSSVIFLLTQFLGG